MGEPGVGKSRLFYEFIRSHRTEGWLVLESSGVLWQGDVVAPLVELLKGYFKSRPRTMLARFGPR